MGYLNKGMKFIVVILLLAMTGCASAGSNMNKDSENMTLEDHLRRLNGVRVTGSGEYAKVMLRPRGISGTSRGMGTPINKKDINLGDSDQRQPLFVVDGQKIGRSYPRVRDMFAPGEIESVRLLPESEASQYGSQSGYGVIEIISKAESMNKEKDG
jgi:hypothetical protein